MSAAISPSLVARLPRTFLDARAQAHEARSRSNAGVDQPAALAHVD
jgi:hypothetical protein